MKILCFFLTSLLFCRDKKTKQNTHALEDPWTPKYHLYPKKGWMGTPNGFSYYKGFYHIFYQYNFHNMSNGGALHWGHARSKDMLSWENLPVALKPSRIEDIGGISPGSAIDHENKLILMYTGVSFDQNQVQCLATSYNGKSFFKNGVVLKKSDGNDKNFRDPKIWKQEDSWFVVVGSESTDGKSEVLLYKSGDLYQWESEGVLKTADENLGEKWRNPDFFNLDNKQILLINLQGIKPGSYEHLNTHQTGYFVGTWKPGSQYEVERGFKEIDHGHDFYAAHTFLAPDGRRILIGWMGMPDSKLPEAANGWAGILTLPRELTMCSCGSIRVKPIREIYKRRNANSLFEKIDFVFNGLYNVMEEKVLRKEILLEIDAPKSEAETFGISIAERHIIDSGVQIYIDFKESRLFLKRYFPKYNITESSRSAHINLNKTVTLDIFIDSSSVEVFVNKGHSVLTSRIYPDSDNERVLGLFGNSSNVVINKYMSWDL